MPTNEKELNSREKVQSRILLEYRVEKVMFGSVKFGGIVLRNVVGNVVRNSDVKLSRFESSSSLKKNNGSGRKTEENLKAGRHQKRKRVREEFREESHYRKSSDKERIMWES